MNKRVCITGMGVITPPGNDLQSFWSTVSEGKNCITQIQRFDTSSYPTQVAGQLNEFSVNDYVPRRMAIKTDTFTHYALAAAKNALTHANINISELDPYRIGVWLGNNAGGWDICERGLYEMNREGPNFVNPWQATAWFLSAPQGYVTIANGIKGMSKSFVCDRASCASAIYYAAKAIEMGHNDIILTGGTEAPITPFAMTCYLETKEMVPAQRDNHAYKPFTKNRSGYLLAEGSVILILEEYQHAIARGATIYGEIVAGSATKDIHSHQSNQLTRGLQTSLRKAALEAKDIDLIFAEGAATQDSDDAEANAFASVFGSDTLITIPKTGFGHLFGASTAADIVTGLLAAKHSSVPPTQNLPENELEYDLNIVTKPVAKKLKHLLINSRAREGSNISMVIKV